MEYRYFIGLTMILAFLFFILLNREVKNYRAYREFYNLKGKKRIGKFHSEKYNSEKKIVEIIIKKRFLKKTVIESQFSFDCLKELFEFHIHCFHKKHNLELRDHDLTWIKQHIERDPDSCSSCGKSLRDGISICKLCGFHNTKLRESAVSRTSEVEE